MQELKPIKEGKVREIYDNGDSLIMVATDRISCFDVILDNVISKKGTVLTQMSKFWFDSLGEQTVKLPDFVGMTLNDATIQCSTLGITFSTLQENSDTVDENVIIRQSVKAGTEMTEDTQLYLIVSKGKKTSSSVAASSGSAGGGSGSSGGSGTNEQADSGTSSVNEDEFITEEEEWGD